MVTIKVDCPDDVAAEQRREFADTVIGAAVDLLGAERAGVRLDVPERDGTRDGSRDGSRDGGVGHDGARHPGTGDDEARARREAAFWAAAWSGC
ncbi:hypothetical protein ACGF0J_25740 [Nonomuraea sp. NPDC047897]|uniref:hypothetical protein n=1 Tax=Nonomuraea sp. NPDC047897 TaxID=3364346 RepID=UPI00372449B0